jgi:hypothetical protein
VTEVLKRKRNLIVVVATRHPGVVAALEAAAVDLQGVRLTQREALSLDGAYRALQGAHLAIVDPAHLAEGLEMLSTEMLEAALSSAGFVTASGADFVAGAPRYLELTLASTGLGEMLPARCAVFTGLAGGVGKTTLALATALAFQQATRLPAAVVELTPGPSALLGLCGGEGADLYRATTQGAAYPVWRGVTLVPMAWETARLLSPEQILVAWQSVISAHIYTAFDAPAWHPLWDLIDAECAFALADARPEAQAAALGLAQRLREEGRDVAVGLNRGGLGGMLALPEKPAFALKSVRDPLTLGPQVLRAVYPGWRTR